MSFIFSRYLIKSEAPRVLRLGNYPHCSQAYGDPKTQGMYSKVSYNEILLNPSHEEHSCQSCFCYLFSSCWHSAYSGWSRMQWGDCRMCGRVSCLHSSSAGHTVKQLHSGLMRHLRILILLFSLSKTPPGYHVSVLLFIFSVKCLLSAPLQISFPTAHNAEHCLYSFGYFRFGL